MFLFVDEYGLLWQMRPGRTEICLTDSAHPADVADNRLVRRLSDLQLVSSDALRKTRRVLGYPGYLAMLNSHELDAAVGVIRHSVARFDAAEWELPRLQTPAQPNDYLILASTLESWGGPKGRKTRDRISEIFDDHYADTVQIVAQFMLGNPQCRDAFDDPFFHATHGFDPNAASPLDEHDSLRRRRNLRACVQRIRDIQSEKLHDRYGGIAAPR